MSGHPSEPLTPLPATGVNPNIPADAYHRDELGDTPSLSASVARFHKRLVVHGDGCWLLDTARNRGGYATFWWKDPDGKIGTSAHRFSYIAFIGPIPEGLVIDHLCRNRACVNPAHLEAVTQRENILRGEGLAAINASKTHCPNGHPYVAENMYDTANGARICRTCQRAKYANSAPPPYWALRTHCSRGHELTPENTYRPVGSRHGRKCRKCHAELERGRRLQRRLAA